MRNQFPNMGNVMATYCPQLGCHQSRNGNCFPRESHKLDFVTCPTLVDMHNRPDITGRKAVFG